MKVLQKEWFMLLSLLQSMGLLSKKCPKSPMQDDDADTGTTARNGCYQPLHLSLNILVTAKLNTFGEYGGWDRSSHRNVSLQRILHLDRTLRAGVLPC
ncbi:hypothetical protein CEXT_34421 [Caerostris extrusa]|uniref:Secreted protein n=1 Tax=Caerostris extrusa TaxID=172846 RepID=A0AAV4WMI8_CAEEX|nr:hypothetical protein CEXT_34421 [Caerostris extrusa]